MHFPDLLEEQVMKHVSDKIQINLLLKGTIKYLFVPTSNTVWILFFVCQYEKQGKKPANGDKLQVIDIAISSLETVRDHYRFFQSTIKLTIVKAIKIVLAPADSSDKNNLCT